MASNVLIQNSTPFVMTPKMESINNNNIVVDSDKNVIKLETNEDNLSNLMDNLMDKLHAKANQMKSWTDLAKIMKQSVNEKRHIIDINERSQLQKCLDTIQKNIRVTSLQSMVERLETICRQLGLKFSVPPQTSPKRVECFVHSEMYYVEVLLEAPTGHVLDCKVAHQAEALSCAELTDVLQKGDFVEFTKHLEGLSAIYQINADKKNKTKAYLALHALEVDLSSLAELQNHQINDINNLVHKSPVGILEPRKGGHPMRLTYFVPPYDLIDLTTKSCLPLNVDVILEKGLGFSATICIESSSSHRLQHESLINTLKTPEGKNLPQFSALTALNSTQLPACFVLKLQKPLVTSLDILKKIRADTNIEFNHELINKSEPIIQLIANQLLTSKKNFQSNGPFYVKLPNQSHCYHLNEGCDKLDGVVITSIPITHPTHVPRILVHLRQQVLFNVIIGSFIRQTSKPEMVSNIFEVTTTSMSNINIQFEHPTEESLATLDLDLRDVTNVKCKLYPTSSLSSFCSDDFASKVMQRCLSIPVTMRSIINKCKERAAALKEQMAREQPSQMTLNQNELYFSSLNSTNGSLDPNLGGRQLQQYLSQTMQYNGTQSAQLQQQMNQQFVGQNNTLQGQQQNLQRFLAQKMQHQLAPDAGPQNRPQMTLQQFQQHQELFQQNQLLGQNANGQKHNTMLMNMLSDIPSANNQMALNLLKQQQQQQHLQQQIQLQQHLQYMQQQQQQQSQQKPKKQRKRKITSDNLIRSPGSSAGKSPKRKLSDDDFSRELPDDAMGADAYQWGNDAPNACRPSSTPSSTASFAETIGNIKQELNISGAQTPTNVGTDSLNSFSYMNSRHPFESNQNDFNDYNANELPLYGDSGGEVMTDIKPNLSLDMSLISAKSANKRTIKRMRSDTSDDASGTGDEGHNEQLKIIKSLEDLHQKESFSKFFAKDSVGISENNLKKPNLNNIKVAKTSNKNDVRRCSSAGIESGSEQKRPINLENSVDITELTVSLKKERKRKRAESVDSLKASTLGASSTTGRSPINSSNMCSESSMMPPPLPASIGDVTSSSCMPLLDGNQQKLISNIKMSPTSSSAGSSPSQTVMKISSSGKKSLIGSSVSSTSGNESKLCKGLTNKLEKSSTLSSMLKNQKHNHLVPKVSDSEGSLSLTPSLSPKALTFKTSKSKASKSGLNSSPGRKEYTKSQMISGTKQKSGNISSTSSMSAPKSSSTAVSSSCSLSPGLSSGASSTLTSSVSSSKQQTAKVAKISRKSSLTAVVDRLHQKQDATGVPTGQPGAPNESGRPESSSLSTSRPDTTSAPKVSQSGSNKIVEPKVKYSRTSDQFTIKQSNSGGGLKMSITKTKLSATDNTNKIGPGGTGLFKTTATSKFTIPKLPKTAPTARPISTSISPSTAATTSSSSALISTNPSIRRQISPNPKITGNIRANVSSSTHPIGPSVSPKGSTGSFNVSHNKSTFGERHNVKTSANQPINKSPVNKVLVDKFKTSTEPSSTTKSVHSTDTLSSSSNIFPVMPKSIVETSRPPVYSKFDGVTLPMPVSFSRSLSASAGNVSPQLPASTTSSVPPNKPIFSKSVSVNESENMERMLSNWGQTHDSTTIESGNESLTKNMIISSNKSVDNNSSPQNRVEKAGVSSSSDVKASTSTPSSPAEMALTADVLQNPPPLIPIEAIDDSSEGGSGGNASVEANVECENSTQITLDSTELIGDNRLSTSIASDSIPTVSATEISNEVSTSENTKTETNEKVETEISAVSESRLAAQVVSESNKIVADEDEDADGLVIDDPSVPSKPIRATAGSNMEAVSSSTSRLSGTESQNKSSTSPTSSSATPMIASNPVLALTSMAGSFCSVASPSNLLTNSSIQRPSPYPIADIDDDLMDEALVGSNE